ncbi:hypothetical protein K7X08_003115 [Anisodus acutangulus]|uniref:Uncharacterized protein n=1 Tax=Anisodus acutangulus TaxID=402998 RepID=A0A9Q1RID2_9SOLA|nr:hypothetical protein K7X08_003115 [Anisodus acutangulus]
MIKFMKILNSSQPTWQRPVQGWSRKPAVVDMGPCLTSEKLLGARQMEGLHEKMKLPTISSGLSEQYKGHCHRTNVGAAEEQETSIDARGLAPGLVALQFLK